MPVVVAGRTRSADALINYALEDKPDQQGERYVMASGTGGLLVSVAKQQMRDVRKKWGKDKPGAFVQAYHVIQSFAQDEIYPESPDSWMLAQRLGQALAEARFPGRQVLVVTQRDGTSGCVHNHLIANAVDTKTGRSLDSSAVTHARLVEIHERVLKEQHFEQRADLRQAFSDATERRERGEPSGLRRAGSSSNSELREFQRHIIWETECDLADEFGVPRNKQPFSLSVLKHSIEPSLADPAAVDWDSFVAIGETRGVEITKRGKKGRGISYGMLREEPDGTLAIAAPSDRRRCTTLGSAFEMDAVEGALASNAAARSGRLSAAPTSTSALPQGTSVEASPLAPRSLTPKERVRIALQEAADTAEALTSQLIASTFPDGISQPPAKSPAPQQTKDAEPDSRTPSTQPWAPPPATPATSLASEEALPREPHVTTSDDHAPQIRPASSDRQKRRRPLPARPLHIRFPELTEDLESDGSSSSHERGLGE